MTGETIQLDHGAGGGMNRELLADLIAPRLAPARAEVMDDGVVLELDASRIVVTSETFTADPVFFGNGDLGRFAVCTTVNELAVRGAVPRYLRLSLVLEQGLALADLARVVDSVREAALEAGVEVLAGETRVVRGGAVDKLRIDTAGIGELMQPLELGPSRVSVGDAVIATGWLANHGVHLMSLRAGLGVEEPVLSDCAPLDGLIWNALEDYAPQVHCMREIGRGGLGGVLNEIAEQARVSIQLEEHRLPVRRATRLAAERLGVDPLHLASAGSICMFVEGAVAFDVLELLHWQPQGRAARIVGAVREPTASGVTMVSPGGGETVIGRC
jgi:hydrogenase expression/formation protein HypE